MNEYAYLRNQGVGGGKLRDGKTCNGELTDADKTYSELRNCQDAAGKLTNRDNTSCHNGDAVRTILE